MYDCLSLIEIDFDYFLQVAAQLIGGGNYKIGNYLV